MLGISFRSAKIDTLVSIHCECHNRESIIDKAKIFSYLTKTYDVFECIPVLTTPNSRHGKREWNTKC